VLSPAVLARVNLAAAAGGLAGYPAVPGDVDSLQAVQRPPAPPDPAPLDRPRLAATRGVHAATTPAFSPATGGAGRAGDGGASAERGRGGGLTESALLRQRSHADVAERHRPV